MLDLCLFFIGRLLYFMLAKYRLCGNCLPVDGMSLDFMIYTLCAMIWHERNLIIEMKIPNATKDLFLEQSKKKTMVFFSYILKNRKSSWVWLNVQICSIFFSQHYYADSVGTLDSLMRILPAKQCNGKWQSLAAMNTLMAPFRAIIRRWKRQNAMLLLFMETVQIIWPALQRPHLVFMLNLLNILMSRHFKKEKKLSSKWFVQTDKIIGVFHWTAYIILEPLLIKYTNHFSAFFKKAWHCCKLEDVSVVVYLELNMFANFE